MSESREIAAQSNAWPFQEARRILERIGGKAPAKGYVLFETGYGPSGLPHIGTFGEVARTSMIRRAFRELSDIPTKLFAFSDDMDGLRKVPDNVPNREMMATHLGKPLTRVPDPFSNEFPSFGAANNARLRAFLDSFGFEYEFLSATECYARGRFDKTLRKVLERYDDVMAIMLPTLGPERRATYSPFLPVSPKTGRVLQVPILERKLDAGTVVFRDEDGTLTETPVTGGHCKLQWKADWAMRWVALEVDYEMSGKDLIDSVKHSSRIAQAIGGEPPLNLTYELFLDEKGEKISKSRGNGLTIEQWLTYASPESLALFMYREPKKAKRLHFDVIPRAVDDYLAHLAAFETEEPAKQLANPVWHIHAGSPPSERPPITFGVLLNLAGVCHSEDKGVLWGFISRYAPGATPQGYPILDKLVGYAINYYRDFVKPTNRYRPPNPTERAALEELAAKLPSLPDDAEALQNEVYEIGKRHPFANLRDWFKGIYEVLFGQSQGPRMGSFIALYGRQETVALIRRALAGEQLAAE
jgi:lysyl-tRNA synthetase, class I